MKLTKLLGAALLTLGFGCASARAALITVHDNFSASGITPAGGPGDPITGSFDVTFDNSADITNSPLILASIDIPISGLIVFTYHASTDDLIVGGSLNGANGVTSGTDDFDIVIVNISTAPAVDDFTVTTANVANQFFGAALANVTLTPVATPTPEPASLVLFAAGLGGLAAARRKRRAPTA